MKFKKGQTVIFKTDVYNDGDMLEYDGTIVNVLNNSVDVVYLDGYHSRNDNIKYKDIVAIVDETRKCKWHKTKSFSGHLIPINYKEEFYNERYF